MARDSLFISLSLFLSEHTHSRKVDSTDSFVDRRKALWRVGRLRAVPELGCRVRAGDSDLDAASPSSEYFTVPDDEAFRWARWVRHPRRKLRFLSKHTVISSKWYSLQGYRCSSAQNVSLKLYRLFAL